MNSIVAVTPDQNLRLSEIGELTALAYLADGLVDQAHPYMPQLRDAAARAEHATLLMMAAGDAGEGAALGTLTVVPASSKFAELATGDDFELRMLAVSPLARGRGVGRKLTRAGMKLAVEQGAKRIVLSTMETMAAAHKLYEKLGFRRLESLDWVVYDEENGAKRLTPEEARAHAPSSSTTGVKLLGYTWEPEA